MFPLIELIQYYTLSIGVTLVLSLVITINFAWFIYARRWRHLPTVPGSYPLIGHLFTFPNKFDFISKRKKRFEQYGDSIILWIFTQPLFQTRDPEIIQHVLSSSDFLSKGQLYWLFKDWLLDGLGLSSGKKWKKRRSDLTKSFHFNILKGFCQVMEKHSLRWVETLREDRGKTIEIFKKAKEFSFAIICETSMGINFDSNETKACAEDVKVILENIATRRFYPWQWFKWSFKLFKSGQEYYNHINQNHNLVKRIIETRIEYRKRNPNLKGKEIFIDSLLNLYEEDEIDVDGIVEEVTSFMFAGHDTISAFLAWCFYLLGRNPECQQKAYEEAQRISNCPNYSLDDRINAMEYIECVVKETLRIHPPGPIIARSVKKDTVIKGMLIPKGTTISMDFLLLHRNEKYWKNPMSFNPDRFDKSVYDSKKNAFLFLPFSAGQRNCIGQKFAMFEMKIALYHILLNFEIFASQQEEDLREIVEIIHKNEDGLHVNLKPR